MSAILYSEWPTTHPNLVADLRSRMLSQGDWTALPRNYLVTGRTLSSGYAAGVTSLNSVSTSTFFDAGAKVVIGRGTANEESIRISGIGTSNFTTQTATVNPHASGESVEWVQDDLLRSTTGSGAELIVSLGDTLTNHSLGVSIYRTATPTLTDRLRGYVAYFQTTPTTGAPLHVDVSIHRDFLWLSIEGPRLGELGYESSPQGVRTSMWLGEVLPYDDTETGPRPVLAVVGASNNSHMGNIAWVSQTADKALAWDPCKLGTVCAPITEPAGITAAWGLRSTRKDGTRFLWPWVVAQVTDGPRGRAAYIYSGHTDAQYGTVAGQSFTYDGMTYMLTPGHDSGASNHASVWGGAAAAASPNPLVAIPVAGNPP